MDTDERAALLERVWALTPRRDALTIHELLSGLPDADLVAEPELGYRLSFALIRLGRVERAEQLIGALLRRCAEEGPERMYRRVLYMRGVMLYEQGELAPAEEVFSDLAAVAGRADDGSLLAASVMNLGVIATIRCQWDVALAAYARAMATLQQIGRREELAYCHQNMGMTYRQLGFFATADAHFGHALSFRGSLSEQAVASFEVERALLFHLRGDGRLAEAMVRRVLGVVERPENDRQIGETLRVLGIIVGGRDPSTAFPLLTRALELARATGTRLLQAEVHEELAALHAQQANPRAAAAHAAESIRLYRDMGAEAHVELIRARLGPDVPDADVLQQV